MLNRTIILALALLIGSPALEAQQTATSQQSVPAFSEWTDDFGGASQKMTGTRCESLQLSDTISAIANFSGTEAESKVHEAVS